MVEVREMRGCGDQRDRAMVEATEMGRLWRSERRAMVEVRDGMVVETREMGGCGNKGEGAMVEVKEMGGFEIREKGRCWRSER